MGDALGCGERSFRRRGMALALRPLGIRRTIAASSVASASLRDPRDPCGGIRWIAGSNDGYAELVDGDEEPSNRVGSERAFVWAHPFNREITPRHSLPKPVRAATTAALDQREMKIPHALPFDERDIVDRVLAALERSQPDVPPAPVQMFRHSGPPLVHVDDDAHPRILPLRVSRACDAFAPTRPTGDFAGTAKSP